MPTDADKPESKVVLAGGAHVALVTIGAVLVVLAIGIGVAGRTVGSTEKKSGDTTTTKAWPSDTQLTGLLTSGAVLILTGFLWTRITAIKLPGGAEIDLTSEEQKKAAEKVGAKLSGSDAVKVAEETQKAVSALRRSKARISAPTLTDEQIQKVVEETVKS